MLYEDIRRGSDGFHQHPKSWNEFYARYMRDRKQHEWDSCSVSEDEARHLKRFLNQWSSHYQAKPHQIARAVNEALGSLNLLRNDDLLHVDFDRRLSNGLSVLHVIETAFDTIVSCGGRYESTATSKILHVANPDLFVMWDMRIRKGYGIVGNGGGSAYGHRFLRMMQHIAKSAVQECMSVLGISESGALELLCPRGQSLAKVIDEYNWDKYVGSVAGVAKTAKPEDISYIPKVHPGPAPSSSEDDVIRRIRERLTDAGGFADVPLMKAGKSVRVELQPNGVTADNLGSQPFLPWMVFSETIALLEQRGGVAPKGDAMNCRLGDPGLPLNSVEGNLAFTVYQRRVGDSVFRRITPVAAILDWSGLCVNCRGQLRLAK